MPYWRLAQMLMCACMAFYGAAASSSQHEVLDNFFRTAKTYQADFKQTVLGEDMQVLQQSRGKFILERPGRFYWSYGDPQEQIIVADGEQLWVYDVGLEQVIVRPQESGLGDTPAGLLANDSGPDGAYLIEQIGEQGGIVWVSLFPKSQNSAFSQIQLGFDNGMLRFVQMLDQMEQITRVRFENIEVNSVVDPGVFALSVPEGVDVIREDL